MAEKEMKNFFLDSFPSVWGFVLPAFGFLEKVENLISELFETEVGGMLGRLLPLCAGQGTAGGRHGKMSAQMEQIEIEEIAGLGEGPSRQRLNFLLSGSGSRVMRTEKRDGSISTGNFGIDRIGPNLDVRTALPPGKLDFCWKLLSGTCDQPEAKALSSFGVLRLGGIVEPKLADPMALEHPKEGFFRKQSIPLLPKNMNRHAAYIEIHIFRVSGALEEKAEIYSSLERESDWFRRLKKTLQEMKVKDFAQRTVRKHVYIMNVN